MVDRTVPFLDLFMLLYDDLSNIQEIPLKEGFSYRFFDGSDEDIKHWMDIEVSSGDCKTLEDARSGFETYYRHYINTLLSRCIFIVNENGLPIATSTAFFLFDPQPGRPEPCENPIDIPSHITGHLHWVAMREECKGKGLSKTINYKNYEDYVRTWTQRSFFTYTNSFLAGMQDLPRFGLEAFQICFK